MKCQVALSLITAVLECLTYAGVVYGWASIYPVLLSEGFFSEKCSPLEGVSTAASCPKQTEALNLVFTVASSSASILNFLTGIVLDWRGCWFTRTALLLLSGTGFLLTAVAEPGATSWLLYVGFSLIAFGGYGLLTVNLQATSNLVPRHRALVAALVSGSFDSSTATFLAVSTMYERTGVTFSTIFYFFAAYSALFHARTFLLTPRRSTPYVLPAGYAYGYKELPCGGGGTSTDQPAGTDGDEDAVENPDRTSLADSFRKPHTWTNLGHFALVQFSLIYFMGIFNTWIATKVTTADEVDSYTRVFGICLCCGILFAPVAGLCVDVCRKRFAERLPPTLASLKAVALTQLLGDLLVILMLVLSLVPSAPAQYVTFALLVMARATLYGILAAFISVSYPSQHFGVVYGFTVAAGGLVLLLQYPVTLLVSRYLADDFLVIYGVLLALAVLSAGHPIYLLVHVRRLAARASASGGELVGAQSGKTRM